MVDFSALNSNQGLGTASSTGGQSQAFREADFLAIMLTEVTNQDPLQPQETAQLVENMQKLQELANTNYEKFRSDLDWAQNLVGRQITVQQQSIDDTEVEQLQERGINPDPGFLEVNGKVDTYKVIGESVWVTVNGSDYPVDNIRQIQPDQQNPDRLVEVGASLIGRRVDYTHPVTGEPDSARVDDVSWGEGDDIILTISGQRVSLSALQRIGDFAGF